MTTKTQCHKGFLVSSCLRGKHPTYLSFCTLRFAFDSRSHAEHGNQIKK